MVAETRFRSPEGQRRAAPLEWVEDSPFWSVTVLFGLGIGVGFIVGHTLAESTGRHLMHHRDTLATKLSCRIGEALKSTLPESVWSHLS